MKADLQDALVPVKWAEAQIPILQQRLIEWNRSGPYRIIVEPEPIPTEADITQIYMVQRVMEHSHAQNKTTLFRIPGGTFHPTKGNTNLRAEIFLNETTAGIGVRPAIVGLRVYCSRVRAFILPP
jgi:hypothetical protein